MEQTLGREVAAEEIAKELHMTTEEVERMQSYIKNPVSLETPVGDEENSNLEDFIEDTAGADSGGGCCGTGTERRSAGDAFHADRKRAENLKTPLRSGGRQCTYARRNRTNTRCDQRTDPSAGVKSIGKTEEISRTKSIKKEKIPFIKY